MASLGALVLVCLNLPLSNCYCPENIYLSCITSGPKEPTVCQIGKVLEPLVSYFLDLWHGVNFSSTSSFPQLGWTIRAMILQVICDLPAVRKVMRLAGHSSLNRPCSFCKIHKGNLDSINSTAMAPRGNQELREAALQWESAKTKILQKDIFKEWGVRFFS